MFQSIAGMCAEGVCAPKKRQPEKKKEKKKEIKEKGENIKIQEINQICSLQIGQNWWVFKAVTP